MRNPPVPSGVYWIGKIFANALDVSFAQFVKKFSIPIASPDVGAAVARADNDDGIDFHPWECSLVDCRFSLGIDAEDSGYLDKQQRCVGRKELFDLCFERSLRRFLFLTR